MKGGGDVYPSSRFAQMGFHGDKLGVGTQGVFSRMGKMNAQVFRDFAGSGRHDHDAVGEEQCLGDAVGNE